MARLCFYKSVARVWHRQGVQPPKRLGQLSGWAKPIEDCPLHMSPDTVDEHRQLVLGTKWLDGNHHGMTFSPLFLLLYGQIERMQAK